MKMHSINIKNFKKFEDVTVEFNSDVNIFTGVNNCGKTTLLEAIALWHECFIKLIKKAERSDKKLKIKQGDYRLGNKGFNYFDFKDIVSVRSPNYEDLFYNLDTSSPIYIEISFFKKNKLIIGFFICRANGNNYEIHVNAQALDYELFNSVFQGFPYPIASIFASPVAHLLFDEEFERDAVIKSKIQQRKSIEVIRNRLHKITNEVRKQFAKDLSFILTNGTESIDYKIIGDYNNDVAIITNIKTSSKDNFKDISLLGSGTLQIIEILLSVYEKKTDLNLILLDEPDSHIHRDIQKRLLQYLSENTKKTQIFITTHNESLIRSANPNYIFHLENTPKKTYTPLGCGISTLHRQGFQESYKLKILKELGGESSLDFINALEADKLIFVEGMSDAKYIDVLLDKRYRDSTKKNIMYWSFEGVENLLLNIKAYKGIFSKIKNQKTLWEKSLIVMDSDWFTEKQREALKKEMKDIGPTVIWPFYTFESVLLTNTDNLSLLIIDFINNYKPDRSQDHYEELTPSSVKEKITELINIKTSKKLSYISEHSKPDNIDELKKWFHQKEKTFQRSEIYKNFCNNMQDHQLNYIAFLKSELDKKNYSIIATKEDVQEICRLTLQRFGVTINEEIDIVYELLKLISPTTWYNQWDELFDLIYT
jgi:AAA15 family ATPase/GTPase